MTRPHGQGVTPSPWGESRGEGISCFSNRMTCTVNMHQNQTDYEPTGAQSRFTLTLSLSRQGREDCLAAARVTQRFSLGTVYAVPGFAA